MKLLQFIDPETNTLSSIKELAAKYGLGTSTLRHRALNNIPFNQPKAPGNSAGMVRSWAKRRREKERAHTKNNNRRNNQHHSGV